MIFKAKSFDSPYRIKELFALFPTRMSNNDIVWLETYYALQYYNSHRWPLKPGWELRIKSTDYLTCEQSKDRSQIKKKGSQVYTTIK